MNELADLRTMAITHHEIFLSYIAAGFNRKQALELVKTCIWITETDNKDQP